VALRANKLVCSAIVVIRSTTSPIRNAAFDNSLMRAVGGLCLTYGFAGDPVRLLTCRLISAIDAAHLVRRSGKPI